MGDLDEINTKNSTPKNNKQTKQYFCNICDFNTVNKKDYNRHLTTNRHKKNEMGIDLGENVIKDEISSQNSSQPQQKKYCCELCDFITCYKKDYTNHLSTNKHKKNTIKQESNTNTNENIVIEIKQPKSYNCEKCNYTTKDLAKYNRHCNTTKHKKNVENTTNPTDTNTTINNCITVDKDVFLQLVRYNEYFKRVLIEQNSKIIELYQNNQINNKTSEGEAIAEPTPSAKREVDVENLAL